tara:strand:+ start:242 stop:1441 length:1200 start_codon:yes stop_codon:yes gene_type:complete
MPIYKFKQNDIFRNVIKAHPSCEFFIHSGSIYYNKEIPISGAFTDFTPNSAQGPGTISLYELNVDRTTSDTGIIYPFITKDGSLSAFKTVSTTSFNSDFGYGDTISGDYPLSASIRRDYIVDTARKHIKALKNTLNHYRPLSPHYQYSSSYGDKDTQDLSLISIPSIFYGSAIQKGSVSLKYYMTGTLIGELRDENKNGELIQVGPVGSPGSASVAGVVLYSEGFLVLTGAWTIENDSTIERDYIDDSTNLKKSSWIFWGTGANDGVSAAGANPPIISASYDLHFSGTTYTPVLTMLAHAEVGELNYSNNPTFLVYGQTGSLNPTTSSYQFQESPDMLIKNTVSSSYYDYEESNFERQTYITKIGIYDEDKNLIGVANLATPVKKKEDQEYTFKLKLDF